MTSTTWLRPVRFLAALVALALARAPAVAAEPPAPAYEAASLYQLSDAESRSISPENQTGRKGQGGRTPIDQGSAGAVAKDLGVGWKVNPFLVIAPGERRLLGEAKGPGIINHIWATIGGSATYRSLILRIYWDGEATPSVETPVGDFFASAFGRDAAPTINSAVLAVNSGSGLNSYWQMPFRRSFRIELENRSKTPAVLYYQVDYALQPVPRTAGYFHAQFRMVDRLTPRSVYTILDGVRGHGQYVGVYLTHSSFSPGWWGEGEVKFYLDGDKDFPTINGTGEEDYFGGSYNFQRHDAHGGAYEGEFSSAYSGFYLFNKTDVASQYYAKDRERRVGEYRWHVLDPVRFKKDIHITIQSLGWQYPPLRYLPLTDGYSSVAFWYQAEPHAPFPALPSDEQLEWKPLKAPAADSPPR